MIGFDVMWNIVKGGCQISLGVNRSTLIYNKVSGPMSLITPVKPNGKLMCHFSQEFKDVLSQFRDLETFTTPTEVFR